MVALYSFRAVESGDLSLEKVSRYLRTFFNTYAVFPPAR